MTMLLKNKDDALL